MLKEFALVIYVIGGGPNNGYDYNTGFNVIKFASLDQCMAVESKIETLVDKWHFGKDKKDVIPAHYSSECIELPQAPYANSVQAPKPAETKLIRAITAEPPTAPLHRRWDDLPPAPAK